jgi:CheY-like chemotaxis protein
MVQNSPAILNEHRILIAEDEVIIAMLLEDVIKRLGGEIVSKAKTCNEVLAALDDIPVDAIILDVHLRGGTSEGVVAAAADKNIPVLVSTGSNADELGSVYRNLPILHKPWLSVDVERALVQLLRTAA